MQKKKCVAKKVLVCILCMSVVFGLFSCANPQELQQNQLDNDLYSTSHSVTTPNTDTSKPPSGNVSDNPQVNELPYPGLELIATTGMIDNSRIGRSSSETFDCPPNDQDILVFHYNELQGYCDPEGNVLIDSQYVNTHPFSEGYAVAAYKKENINEAGYRALFRIIDTSGREVYVLPELENGRYHFSGNSFFQNNKYVFMKWVDSEAYICTLDSNMRFSETKLDLDQAGIKYQNVSGEPKIINTPQFSGVILVDIWHNAYLFNTAGELIYTTPAKAFENLFTGVYGDSSRPNYALKYYDFGDGSFGLFHWDNGYLNVANEAGKWGLLQLSTGRLEVDCKYDYVGAYTEGLLVVSNYGKWGAVTLEGDTVIPFNFKQIGKFTNGRAFAIDNNDCCVIINTKGETMDSFDKSSLPGDVYYAVSAFSYNGIAVAADGHEVRVINNRGEVLARVDRLSKITYYSQNYIVIDEQAYHVVQYEQSKIDRLMKEFESSNER